MRQIAKTMTLVLLAGAMLAGCDYGFPEFRAYKPKDIAADKKTEKGNGGYLDDMVEDKHADKDANTAVDIAARLSEKYGDALERLNKLQENHQALIEKDKSSQQQIGKLKLGLARAEKELTEANAMLKEMQGELKKWKEDVLGFRSEMRQSQKALLEGVTRLHVLISGGVAMEAPTTQPASPIASNTKEKTSETPR